MEDTKAIELLKKEPNNPKAIEHLYKKYALEIGFKNVVSFPLARSSYYE